MANEIKTNLYIYGMGHFGVRTYMLLKDNGILIKGFIDANPIKQGKNFDGIECISPAQFCAIQEEDMQVIIALEKDADIMASLQEMGIEHLISFRDVVQKLEVKYDPIHEMSVLKENFQKICSKD